MNDFFVGMLSRGIIGLILGFFGGIVLACFLVMSGGDDYENR
jgi:hypothetical protein